MTVATVIAPGPEPPSPGIDLDTFSVPVVLPGAAAPTRIQDVVVTLPADDEGSDGLPALTLAFDMDATDLEGLVAETCDSIFVIAGLPGLTAFERALGRTAVRPPGDSFLMTAAPGIRPPGMRGELLYRDARRSPNRHQLMQAFKAYTSGLSERRKAAEATVGDAARTAARTRLSASREQLITEALRYLSVSGGSRTAAAAALSGTTLDRLTGREAVALAEDLVVIAHARDHLGRLEREQHQEEAAVRSVFEEEYTRRSVRQGYPITPAQAEEAARGMALVGELPSVSEAKRRTTDQRTELAGLVADLAGNRPLLYKLWHTEAPFLARQALQAAAGNPGRRQVLVAESEALSSAVLGPMRATWTAALDLASRVASDADLVWRFPTLIDQVIAEGYCDDSDFVGRVALDRVREDEPARDLMEISDWLGWVALIAGPLGAEPVAIAAAVAQVLVDVGALLVKVLRRFERELGVDAFLAPSAGLAVPDASSTLMVDLFFLGLGILSSATDVRALRRR